MDTINNITTTRYKYFIKKDNQLYSIKGYNNYYQHLRTRLLSRILKYNQNVTIVIFKYIQNDLDGGNMNVFKTIEIPSELNIILNFISIKQVYNMLLRTFKKRTGTIYDELKKEILNV